MDGQWVPCWQAHLPLEQVLWRQQVWVAGPWPSCHTGCGPWRGQAAPLDAPTSGTTPPWAAPACPRQPQEPMASGARLCLTRSCSRCGAQLRQGRRPPRTHTGTPQGAHTARRHSRRGPRRRHSQAHTWWAPGGRHVSGPWKGGLSQPLPSPGPLRDHLACLPGPLPE